MITFLTESDVTNNIDHVNAEDRHYRSGLVRREPIWRTYRHKTMPDEEVLLLRVLGPFKTNQGECQDGLLASKTFYQPEYYSIPIEEFEQYDLLCKGCGKKEMDCMDFRCY